MPSIIPLPRPHRPDHGDGSKPRPAPVGSQPRLWSSARRRGSSATMDSNGQHQSRSVHHPAGNRRHFRRRHLDALDRHRGRDGHPGKGRQRLRRRRRHRVHAAGGRAASERPRRRRADHRARRQARPHRGDLRPGPGAGAAPPSRTTASEGLEMVPGTGLLAACVPGTFESWMLLLRDYGTMRLRDVLEPAIAYARDGYPLVERASRHHPDRRAIVPQALADLGRGLSAERQGAEARHALHQSKTCRDLCPHPEGSRKRRRRPRSRRSKRARKAWSHGFVAEAIDNSAAPRRSWTSAARRIAAC